jgi:hypothetical protein
MKLIFRKMTMRQAADAQMLLATFLREDEHYLASAAAYGDQGPDSGPHALVRAIALFLKRPELGFVWLAYADGKPAGCCVVCGACARAGEAGPECGLDLDGARGSQARRRVRRRRLSRQGRRDSDARGGQGRAEEKRASGGSTPPCTSATRTQRGITRGLGSSRWGRRGWRWCCRAGALPLTLIQIVVYRY